MEVLPDELVARGGPHHRLPGIEVDVEPFQEQFYSLGFLEISGNLANGL